MKAKRLVWPGLALSLLLCAPVFPSPSAPPRDIESAQRQIRLFRAQESLRLERMAEILKKGGVQPSQQLDVLHYDIALGIDPGARTVTGTVTMRYSPTAPLSQIKMRLHGALQVTAATADGQSAKPKRKGADITFKFSPPLPQGGTHELSVSYGGSPQVTGGIGGGMLFSSHGGTPSATTLSEPFDSYAWWPCVDDVTDKSTADVLLTVPGGMVGASNGTLVGTTTNTDGTLTYHWREAYPIANYLISANVTNYAKFSDAYTSLDGSKQMSLDYFVYPEQEGDARDLVVRIPDMIRFFAESCGEYPFLEEKYGMVAFPWGGGMEHQTLTSMGDEFLWGGEEQDGIYSHELAHMWWGDAVTCGTWNDIWLNEGFATYLEVLWLCEFYRMPEAEMMSQYYDDGQYNGFLGGSVYVKNGNKPFNDTGAIYVKGAWVLHMLKRVMGEDAFWQALRDYRAAHEGGNAATADLRAACEARHGQDLAWFFDQWVYTRFRPIYEVAFTQNGGSVQVTVSQRQTHSIANRTADRDVYVMPVDITLHFSDGSEETHSVQNDRRTQAFTFSTPKQVRSVGFDEESWILKVLR